MPSTTYPLLRRPGVGPGVRSVSDALRWTPHRYRAGQVPGDTAGARFFCSFCADLRRQLRRSVGAARAAHDVAPRGGAGPPSRGARRPALDRSLGGTALALPGLVGLTVVDLVLAGRVGTLLACGHAGQPAHGDHGAAVLGPLGSRL